MAKEQKGRENEALLAMIDFRLKALGMQRSFLSALKESTLIVASSDMTHYEPQVQAKEKDQEAIKAILELNEDKLIEKIMQYRQNYVGGDGDHGTEDDGTFTNPSTSIILQCHRIW